MARNGIVATSQPLAAQAGLRILMAGGNAIDAAVATVAVLNLVEPMNVGAGGDLFAIFYIAKEEKLYQLNAGGMMPTGATVERYNSLGYLYDPKNWGYGSGMPVFGILSAPALSAAWGWDEALRKFGTMTFKEVLQPAIDYAERGFPISEVIGNSWRLPNAVNCSPKAGCTQPDPDSVRTWYINGQPPKPGDIFR
ncbi:MAG TPA: gamma-glutamyltransferase, partial [Candidatus Methylomirabilis sp.]|nr:gamma-glutamyltransferase [Candidatus Methylomirabilis sp.]